MNYTCPHCESEFFVETQEEVTFCVVCGEELEKTDDWFDGEEIDDEDAYWKEE